MDGLALGVVEPVHRLDAGEHGEAPVADEGEAQGDQQSHPNANGEDRAALPGRAELGLGQVEHLQLHAWEGEAHLVLGVALVRLERGEHAGLVAVESQADGGVDAVVVRSAHLQMEETCN